MADEPTKWMPSDNQRAMLKIFQDADYDLSVNDACRQLPIDRPSYYHWFDHPEFVAWWQDQHERFFALGLNEVHAAIRDGAVAGKKGGNTAAQKLYLERFDARYMPKTKQEIDSRVTIEGLIAELGSEEKDEKQDQAAGSET